MTRADDEIDRLMRRALAGDRRDYARALTLLAPRMRAMANRDLPRGFAHLAEDVVQEALLAIHLKRGSWDQDRPILPWVRVIMRHKAIDAIRSGARNAHEPIDDQDQIGAPLADPLEALHIEQALKRLPERDAALVRRHAVIGEDAESLSQSFELSPGALRVALHRALRRLADAARKDEEWTPMN